MISIDKAINICKGSYRRFYNIEVDCKDYLHENNRENRTIIFRQPTYIDYIRSGTAPEIRFFSKRILCEKIFLFIKQSNFINSIEDLYKIDLGSPELFEKIIEMTNIISDNFTDKEIKIINEIIDALIKGMDFTKIEFDSEEEEGIFKWSLPFIFTFWTTQDENGLIRISTKEVFDLLLQENRLMNICQQKAIEYKKQLIEREIAKNKRKK